MTMKNNITYTQEDQALVQALNRKVQAYLKEKSLTKYGTTGLHVKAAVLFLAYATSSVLIYFSSTTMMLYLLYMALGLLSVFLALNIGHEAAHNIFCKNKKWNRVLVYIFDLLGASSQIWVYKHVHTHHTHTNVAEVDLELKQGKIVRIFPQDPLRVFHRYQHLYMPFLYCIYTLVWMGYRDFKDFFSLRQQLAGGRPFRSSFIFFFGKLLFITRLIILPATLLPFSIWTILGAFVIFHLAASITVTFALISTHVGEHTQFPVPNEEGQMGHSWVKHQFMTTSDFATDNRLITALYGGFNHHLTHHLFPYLSHVHYPVVTEYIQEISRDYNIATFPQPSIWTAIGSHFRLLRRRSLGGEKTLEWMEM